MGRNPTATLGEEHVAPELVERGGPRVPPADRRHAAAVSRVLGRAHRGIVEVGGRAIGIREEIDGHVELFLELPARLGQVLLLGRRRLVGQDGVVEAVGADGDPVTNQFPRFVPVHEELGDIGAGLGLELVDEFGDRRLARGCVEVFELPADVVVGRPTRVAEGSR